MGVTGDVLVALGRYTEAIGAYESAAGLASDVSFSAGVEHKLAEVHHRLGDWAVADDHLRAALELLSEEAVEGDVLLARVNADRALLAYRRGDVVAARELASSAVAMADPAQDAMAAAQALDVLGHGGGIDGRSRRQRNRTCDAASNRHAHCPIPALRWLR